MDDVIHERYRELACASIVAGINEWLQDDEASDYKLYKWLNECTWFDYLELDREYFYVKILKLKRKGIRSIKWVKYGKEVNI